VCPEAAAGGEIGLLEEGDTILIDIPNGKVNALVSDEEFAVRRSRQVMPAPSVTSGWLARYARGCAGANDGAVMK
ncbi:MAG TPA: dihydroxy-acid dehydratase, partial [Methanocorpusculum sp.]|nr:dihydroxy-acid dehydratase [Methanocorpusculum sp.]